MYIPLSTSICPTHSHSMHEIVDELELYCNLFSFLATGVSRNTHILAPTTHHKYIHKPIPSTHIPAGQSMYPPGKYYMNKAIPWSQDDVVEFLKRIGYEEYVPSFKDNVSATIVCMF